MCVGTTGKAKPIKQLHSRYDRSVTLTQAVFSSASGSPLTQYSSWLRIRFTLHSSFVKTVVFYCIYVVVSVKINKLHITTSMLWRAGFVDKILDQ